MTLFDWYIITRTKHLGIEDIKKGKHVESGPFDRASVKRLTVRIQENRQEQPALHRFAISYRLVEIKKKEKRMDK